MIFDVFKSFYNPHYQDFGLSPSHETSLPSQEGIIILLPLILSLGMLVWSPGRTNCINLAPKIFEQINFQSVVKCQMHGQWILVKSNGPLLSRGNEAGGRGGRAASLHELLYSSQAGKHPSKREEIVGRLSRHAFLYWNRAITVLTLFWPAVQVVDSAIILSLSSFALTLMGWLGLQAFIKCPGYLGTRPPWRTGGVTCKRGLTQGWGHGAEC